MIKHVLQPPDPAALLQTRLDTDHYASELRKRIDVLALKPPYPHDSRALPVAPQTSLAQIAAVLDAAGYAVDIIDAPGQDMPWDLFERRIWELRPRYLIIQASAGTLTNDMRAALIGKAAHSITFAIGAHVTALSRETLAAYPPLDIVVRGEPELTILDIIQTLDRYANATVALSDKHTSSVGPALIAHALHDTRGITYRDEQLRVRINPDRAAIENLDSLPIPLHERLPWPHYRQPLNGAPYACVHTSRGCPANCRFCLKHVTAPAAVRHRSVEHVLQELNKIETLGIRFVHFEADLFTVRKHFVYELCSAIVKHGIRLRWSCNSRVDSLDHAELKVMCEAGCFLINWAIESGNAAVLRRAGKTIALDQIHETIEASRRLGLNNWGHFQLGLPGETSATIQETIAFSKRLPLDHALFRVAIPYPGTPFYTEALEQGWLKLERWEDYGLRTVLNYPHLSSEQLDNWVRRATRAWAWRPRPLRALLKGSLRAAPDTWLPNPEGHTLIAKA